MGVVPKVYNYCKLLGEEQAEGLYSDLSVDDAGKLWDHGDVPFIFDGNVPDEVKEFVIEAMEKITSVSSINFIERTCQTDYIEIIDRGRFASHVGRKGGRQVRILLITIFYQ